MAAMTHFDSELLALKQRLVALAQVARSAIDDSMSALVDRDAEAAARVALSEDTLDQGEKEIDERVVELFTHAPLATQLRLLIVATKIAHDLERIGDEATTIARRARELASEPTLKPYVDLPRMRDLAQSMLRDALEAFIDGDTAKARAVIPRDKEVDLLNRQLQRELAGFMVESPSTISRSLHLITISKALERIADHAKNIAEDTVYLHEAKDIRHLPSA